MINHKKGFTLLEVLVAISLITVGAVGSFNLIQRISTFTSVNSSRLQAIYLGQEGIEIVRNIRDSNWLAGVSWDAELPEGDWEADYAAQTLQAYNGGRYLNIDNDNFYSYLAGDQTKFKRKITISAPVLNKMTVSIEVSWEERKRFYQIAIEEDLYNWR